MILIKFQIQNNNKKNNNNNNKNNNNNMNKPEQTMKKMNMLKNNQKYKIKRIMVGEY